MVRKARTCATIDGIEVGTSGDDGDSCDVDDDEEEGVELENVDVDVNDWMLSAMSLKAPTTTATSDGTGSRLVLVAPPRWE